MLVNKFNMIEKFDGEHSFLSSFVDVVIEYDGITYNSIEHAYQATKTIDLRERKMIAALNTSGQAKRAGSKLILRDDWEQVKLQVMYELCQLKYAQEPFKQLLLDTENRELIEGNYWNDTFWGVCDGKGHNHLGRIIMRVREELRDGR